MKDSTSFREPISHLPKESQAFAQTFEDLDKRDCVIRLMNQGMSVDSLKRIHVSNDTDYSKLIVINRMNSMLIMDGKRRIIHSLDEYGIDCNLSLCTLGAMNQALTSYRWDAEMTKKLAPLDESQIDVVMTGYMICYVNDEINFFKNEVMNHELTIDEMMDKIASVSDTPKK